MTSVCGHQFAYYDVWTAQSPTYSPSGLLSLYQTPGSTRSTNVTMFSSVRANVTYMMFNVFSFGTYAEASSHVATAALGSSSVLSATKSFRDVQCLTCSAPAYNVPALTLDLDGSDRDWPTDPSFLVRYPFYLAGPSIDTNSSTVMYQGGPKDSGPYDGDGDHASWIGFAWNETGLFIVARVQDQLHVHTSTSAYFDDAMQFAVSSLPDRSRVTFLGNTALRSDDGRVMRQNQWTAEMLPLPPTQFYDPSPGINSWALFDAAISRNTMANVTIYEVFVRNQLLNVSQLVAGLQLGACVAVVESDTTTKTDVQEGWDGYSPSCVMFGKSPLETGLLTLMGE